MNRLLIAIFICLLPGWVLGEAYESPVKAGALESLIIQDKGRLKPLDTYARSQLLLYHGKQTIDKQKAIDWLLELLIAQDKAYERKVFTVREKDAIQALGIGIDPDHRYSFETLFKALSERMDSLRQLSQKAPEARSRVDTQLLMLYQKVMQYLALSRSLTGLQADIVIDNVELAEAMGFEPGKAYTYREFMERREGVARELGLLQGRQEGDSVSEKENALIRLFQQLQMKIAEQSSDMLRIVKPEENQKEGEWLAPWTVLNIQRPMSDWEVDRIKELEVLVAAFSKDSFADVSSQVAKANESLSVDVPFKAELIYNKGNFFVYSNVFYILAFLLLLISYMVNSAFMRKVSLGGLVVGLLLHTTGLVFRIYIMGRPPVSTLYESIIFVGWVLVFICVVVELVRSDTLGLLLGSVGGIVLHFIGFSYAAEGDTLGMLVAVLNSNFWLGTHVLTITIGYGVALAAGLVAHFYLLNRIFNKDGRKKHREIFNVSYGICLVAVFFTTFGTILGGIWGDQSWGRFWGWDPKENGALLIVLWLLFVVHGRLAGRLKELGFSVLLALTPITVALAWFGVNLLQVGLHSYGFDDGVATKLYWFCIGEAVFAIEAGTFISIRSGIGAPKEKSVREPIGKKSLSSAPSKL
ncbi:MAG: cytochrome c biogenesis protein CcsA [Verrucomicrobiae bacterium]|nr:cytochrome c biogenesis protein CcsA [Verrucomicrobiae bacterium]